MADEKCEHTYGLNEHAYESGIWLYSEQELHEAIIWQEGSGSGEVTIFNFCPDCGEQLVK